MDIAQSSGDKGDLKVVRYREEEAIYIQASHDRVTVIFSTVFKEEADRVYGKVFLQVCAVGGSRFLMVGKEDLLNHGHLVGICGRS